MPALPKAFMVAVCACVAPMVAGCNPLSVSVAEDFKVLASGDAAVNLPNPYIPSPVEVLDERPDTYYWINVFAAADGGCFVRWEGKTDIGEQLKVLGVTSVSSCFRAVSPEGVWTKTGQFTAPRGMGLASLVIGRRGQFEAMRGRTDGDRRAVTVWRVEGDPWHSEQLTLVEDREFRIDTWDLGVMHPESFTVGYPVPLRDGSGRHVLVGSYVYHRWWDVLAMIAPQPSRRWAALVDGDKIGPARQVTPALSYGNVSSYGPDFSASRRGWVVATYWVYEFEDAQPRRLSLWDGSSWQTVAMTCKLPVPSAPDGRMPADCYMPVLLDQHLLCFARQYCFVVEIRCAPDGKSKKLVWVRGLDFGEGRVVERAVNLGDSALAILRNKATSSWEYVYVTPQGASDVKPLSDARMPYLHDSYGVFGLRASDDGTCHLAWQCKDTKRLCYMRLKRAATSDSPG